MSLLSARETAYQTIRSRIITMELKPGDPLNDRELAEELGISRTPMREALLMLNLPAWWTSNRRAAPMWHPST